MISDASTIRWKRVASFWVPGEPVGAPRMIPKLIAGHARAVPYNPKRKSDGKYPIEDWKNNIKHFAFGKGPREPFNCPVKVDILFYFPRPKSHYRTGKYADQLKPNAPIFHESKPDKDNAEKLVLDVLTKSGWWADDSRVVTGTPTKLYHGQDGKPGAMITVSVIDESQMMLGGAA